MSISRAHRKVQWIGPASLVLAAVLACVGGDAGPFASPLHADHPLVGRIVMTSHDGEASWKEIERRAEAARFVLLGETHDNPDHHRLQARLIERLAAGPRPPAVAFEMLRTAQQAEVDAFLASGRRDPVAFARQVGWAQSGWPDFSLYEPVFAAVLSARLPILAAGLQVGDAVGDDDAGWRARFGLGQPLPPPEQSERIEELFESHCELIPRDQLAPMLAMQRERDAFMAEALLRGVDLRGRAVLVAGAGHTARFGVPAMLKRVGVAPESILAVGFLEVDPEALRPEDTTAGDFDVAAFTPAAEREDPCKALRRHLERRSGLGRRSMKPARASAIGPSARSTHRACSGTWPIRSTPTATAC
jgi:uncharacterized iron-regulated protein